MALPPPASLPMQEVTEAPPTPGGRCPAPDTQAPASARSEPCGERSARACGGSSRTTAAALCALVSGVRYRARRDDAVRGNRSERTARDSANT
ncbi:hypothetical protein SLNWT_3857 [Streptomyces albus]|uniref:Uncharacterized protein n=1 Tax=Streptomyces albus (strain ATCC 21838 / DSM 41398 / FERM P-419 / JCM 4703 / NBRC 107858) TaxID=1081613 RepID=A0A0B5ENK2_STRA4|nr:hypothetical protein SLNWT_3857 [Streptomyces albus]AOU78540.1 hypothetical protein SLNHY_3849 [Streptomyces albus]AYN34282.1 hypothetical protein DUI70_3784 [Streptomyces albus]